MPDPVPDNVPPPRQGIVSNFLSLFLGTACVQVINLAYLTYAARVVGPDTFGVFSYLLAFQMLLMPVISFGRNVVITREVAISTPDRQHRFLRVAWFQQTVSAVAAAGLFCLAAAFVPKLAAHLGYVVLTASTLVLLGPGMVIEPFFLGARRMAVCSIASVVQTLTKAVLGLVLLFCGFTLGALFWPLVVSSASWSVQLLRAYRRHAGRTLTLGREPEGTMLLKDGGQVALGQLTNGIFTRFDWVFLGSLKASATLGVYSVASRVFELFIRIPGLLAVSAFPALCQHERQARDNHAQVQLALKLAMLPGCLIAACAAWWWEPAILLVLGPGYSGAALILTVLCLSLVFHGGCGIYYHLAIARRRQAWLVWSSGATAVANVLLCLTLIPYFESVGAAISSVIPAVLQFFLLGRVAQEGAGVWIALWQMVRSATVTALISGAVWATGLHWIPAVILAGSASVVGIWFWGGFTPAEKVTLRGLWQRSIAGFRWNRWWRATPTKEASPSDASGISSS